MSTSPWSFSLLPCIMLKKMGQSFSLLPCIMLKKNGGELSRFYCMYFIGQFVGIPGIGT